VIANEVVEGLPTHYASYVTSGRAGSVSRQPLPTLDRRITRRHGCRERRICATSEQARNPEVILIASGSEVSLLLEDNEKLVAEAFQVARRVAAVWGIFEHQSREYQDKRLPPQVTARVAVEPGIDRRMGALHRPGWANARHEKLSANRRR